MQVRVQLLAKVGMESVLSAMKRAARRGKPGELDLEGLEFHELLQRASRLRFAGPQLETMRDHINRYRARTIGSPGRAEAILEEHAEVLRWIKARDADRAEEAMRHHIWNAWVILSEDMTPGSGTSGE